jgi:hypothetical protein
MTVGPALQSLKGLDRHFTCPVAHVKAPKRWKGTKHGRNGVDGKEV